MYTIRGNASCFPPAPRSRAKAVLCLENRLTLGEEPRSLKTCMLLNLHAELTFSLPEVSAGHECLKTEYTLVTQPLSMRGAADGGVCKLSRFAGVSEAEAEAGARRQNPERSR